MKLKFHILAMPQRINSSKKVKGLYICHHDINELMLLNVCPPIHDYVMTTSDPCGLHFLHNNVYRGIVLIQDIGLRFLLL